MIISLSPDELTAACSVACRRRIESIFRRRIAESFYAPENVWTHEIEGACAEMAVARCIDKYWSGSIFNGVTAKADVASYGVRQTMHENGRLIVYEKDSDDLAFVLVVGHAPNYRMAGWMKGRDAKQDRWWKSDAKKPAWFVPQEALKPFKPRAAVA